MFDLFSCSASRHAARVRALHDQVELPWGLDDLVELDDVRVPEAQVRSENRINLKPKDSCNGRGLWKLQFRNPQALCF